MNIYKDDMRIILLLQYKREKTTIEKMWLNWLRKSYPSFIDSEDLKNELYNKKYLEDISGWEDKFDENTACYIPRPDNVPVIFRTTLLGEKAIYSNELKSEKTEYLLDKTLVRWGAIIGGIYAVISFVINLFRYVKNNFL